ncbi:NAD(P)/FAD-dependent oxidoreductase [Pseudomonas lini]
MINRIAIIGSGLAGVRAAQALRLEGFSGQVFLIGDEPHLPYDRPSLSKELLSGEFDIPPDLAEKVWYEEQEIELLAGQTVLRICAASKQLEFASGGTLSPDVILLATGSRARQLRVPGSALKGIHTLRSIDDARQLQGELRSGGSLVVVGGGLIGCEVACTARAAGMEVTVIEAGCDVMQRILDPATARWCRMMLERTGIKFRLDTGVTAFDGTGQVRTVVCADGSRVKADLVLVSIGAVPSTELASAAGLECEQGIIVDGTGATKSPHIFAAGDAASWPLVAGGRRSLETYLNSQAQAAVAARAMLGKSIEALQTPLSWTKLASHNLQMAGDLVGPGNMVVRGDIEAGSFLSFRLRGDQIVACVSVNAPKDATIARRLVEMRAHIDPALLADDSVSLRDLLPNRRGELGNAIKG